MRISMYIILIFLFLHFAIFVIKKIIRYKIIIKNNEKFSNGITCPICGNKMQLVIMKIFDKSKDICNICGFEDYCYVLRKEK